MNFSHSLNCLPFETVLLCVKTTALERAVKATEAAALTTQTMKSHARLTRSS